MKLKLNADMATGTQLVQYDSMCLAIAECVRVDEVKDLRDKAMALQLYYKQSRNLEAERQACNVRLRAERRAGELLKALTKATKSEAGIKGNVAMGRMSDDGICVDKSPYADALEANGISRQTAHRYQALAAVPQEVMDAALSNGEDRASATAILQSVSAKVEPMPRDSLRLWGQLRQMERDGFFDKDISELLAPLTPTMRADMVRLSPMAADFYNQLKEVINEIA